MRRPITASGLLLAFAGLCTATALGAPSSAAHGDPLPRPAVAYYTREIRRLRNETWYWQRVMGVPRSRPSTRELAASSGTRLRRLDALWRARERAAFRHAQHPPRLAAWLCIHRYEAAWDEAGAIYYGGLQMDLPFQRAYGAWLLRRKGTADHWTPLEQIWTAVKAHRVRGFEPWPNTARICGLF